MNLRPTRTPSLTVSGTITDSRGVVGGITITPTGVGPQDYLVSWDHYSWLDNQQGYSVFVNGVWVVNSSTNSAIVSGLIPGSYAEVSVLPWSGSPDEGYRTATLYATPMRGRRLRISWTPASVADAPLLVGYRLYWDEGDGGAVDRLCTTLYGRNNTAWLSAPLADGDYVFTEYHLGAMGDEVAGPTVTGTVNPEPLAVEDQAIVYDQATRKATITATKPTQSADVRGYCLLWNYTPEAGTLGKLIISEQGQIAWKKSSETLNFETSELFAGRHRFAWSAVDTSGQYGDLVESVLELEMVGNDLVALPARPDPPDSISAQPHNNGIIRVTVELGFVALLGSERLDLYQDSVLVKSWDMGSGSGYGYGYEGDDFIYDATGLTDGQAYIFTAVLHDGTISSDAIAVTETAVDRPMTNSSTITRELLP